MFQTAILVLIFLGNFWIWKIFHDNFLIFTFLIISTFSLYFLTAQKHSIKWLVVFLLSLSVLGYFQWKTTTPQSLILLENDEQRVLHQRLKFYNSVGTSSSADNPSSHYIRLLFYRLNLKNFLEGDFNTVTFRLQRNFFESIDLNVYFFAGHPRERVWASDFEKFPFILIIPFLLGLYHWVLQKRWIIGAYMGVSLILLSLIGHKNNLGPFILFPVIVLLIWNGLVVIKKNVK